MANLVAHVKVCGVNVLVNTPSDASHVRRLGHVVTLWFRLKKKKW